MIAVHLLGSSGVGKTTLADYIAKKYGIQKLPSASRSVFADGYKEKYKDYANLMADQTAYKDFQGKVFVTQAAMEATSTLSYVSERAFDHIVYQSMYGMGADETYASEAFAEYLSKFRMTTNPDYRVVLFFVRPTGMCFNAARAGNDRSEFLVWDDVQRFDGALEFILHAHKIPYIPVSCVRMRERTALVDAVLGPLFHVPMPYDKAREDWGAVGDVKVSVTEPGSKERVKLTVKEVAEEMQRWLFDRNLKVDQINLSALPTTCPLHVLKMRNDDTQAVLEYMKAKGIGQ